MPAVRDEDPERADVTQTLALTHVHLPKLADYGFIEGDRANDEVIKGPAFDEIRPLLKLLDTHQDELPGDWI
jgi:hypothetical protein